MHAILVYPHQLYPHHPAAAGASKVYLVEDPLFFTQYNFHCHKLILHRASMQHHAAQLRNAGHRVAYVTTEELRETGDITKRLAADGVERVRFAELSDDWLGRRLKAALDRATIAWDEIPDPHFLTPAPVFDELVRRKRKWFFHDFYIDQRKRLGILVNSDETPVGEKWSFDSENRSRLPKDCAVPSIAWPEKTSAAAGSFVTDAAAWVRSAFPNAPGDPSTFHYPVTREQALSALTDFLEHRLKDFGLYEDAISDQHTFLFHSVLTPALNTGLLSPREVVDKALSYASKVPLNSLEGFVRQVIGWREYMRGVYLHLGRTQRTRNFFGHTRRIPPSFYSGTTGIAPVDASIRRAKDHAYCHHIERLMILGSFMLICEFSPDSIYQWFMEMFIDAYDWVMVPNVYGMSQYADGGLVTTKPYLCGSSYVLKMSNFKKGPWCPIWDALYWRFIHLHRESFAKNPRMAMMVKLSAKLGPKLDDHVKTANRFLATLDR